MVQLPCSKTASVSMCCCVVLVQAAKEVEVLDDFVKYLLDVPYKYQAK